MTEERKDLLPLFVLGGLMLFSARRAEARKPEEKQARKPEEKPAREEKRPEERLREPMLRILPIEVLPKVKEEPKKVVRREIRTPLNKLEIRETPLGTIIRPPIGLPIAPIALPGQFVSEIVKRFKGVLKVIGL